MLLCALLLLLPLWPEHSLAVAKAVPHAIAVAAVVPVKVDKITLVQTVARAASAAT